MQTNEFDPLLANATAEVLETMCFMSVIEGAQETLAPGQDWVAAKLAFRGPSTGEFGLHAPLSTARVLAANFLGEEEAQIDPQQAAEVVCEISNMICGSFLSRLGGGQVYDLSHPANDPLPAQAQAYTALQMLSLDEGLLQVWLNLEPTA
jgi:CheY-specific phosphatase CheX